MLGEGITAERAKELGIVQNIYDSETIFEEQEKIALRLARRSTFTLMMMKKLITIGFEKTGDTAREFEKLLFNMAFALPGGKEGIDAFLQRRKADYTGK